jgi:FlaA1/EpsC-like NDP-sugar epimerase
MLIKLQRRFLVQLFNVVGFCAERASRQALADGQAAAAQGRDVRPEDLLGRAELVEDGNSLAAYLADQVVLITGAGGSIGSELSRQVARAGPRQLLLVGHGENSIYEIDRDLRQAHPDLNLRPIIADIRDQDRIGRVFAQFAPGVVFHAAAHKHVPLMEWNAEEAVTNNIFGTLAVASAARRHGAARFVMVSTDKAVDPVNVMGASKRIAEHVVQSLNGGSSTVFAVVRFGNVLGSRGSVVPLFREQIAAGGPVTLTDTRMERYFMTIPEAAQLVIGGGALATGGEIFVLDMGEPVRMIDLARNLIRLSGYRPDEDIAIISTGTRRGERLREHLLAAGEIPRATSHRRILAATAAIASEEQVMAALGLLREAVDRQRVTAGLMCEVADSLTDQATAGRETASARERKTVPAWDGDAAATHTPAERS